MEIPIGPFNLSELVNLAFSLVAFAFIYKAYRKGANDAAARKFWVYFLLIAAIILLAKIFDTLDDLAFEPYFNMIQHASSIAVAAVFLLAGKNILKGGLHG